MGSIMSVLPVNVLVAYASFDSFSAPSGSPSTRLTFQLKPVKGHKLLYFLEEESMEDWSERGLDLVSTESE